ncbi:MAG: PAS domain S-box protein [Balneolaceae bacterium]
MQQLKKLVYGGPAVIGLMYLVIGLVWIAFSDQWVFSLFEDPEAITTMQMYKGWGFVVASSIFIYILVQINNNKLADVIQRSQRIQREHETVFEQAPVGIAYNKPNEQWLRVNHKLCSMLDYTRDELLRLKFEDFIHPDYLESGRQLDQELITGEKSGYETEKKYIKKNGDYLLGKVKKSLVYNGDHSPKFIIALVEDITEQKETNEKLKKSLRQQEILLSEVLHRVNNNLALIIAFLDLEMDNIRQKPCRDLFKKCQMRIKTVGIVHHKLYQAADFSRIPIREYIQEILSAIFWNWRSGEDTVSVNSNVNDVNLNVNQAIPCGLIINELVTNAYKHAFPKKTETDEVQVKIRKIDNELILSVSDNGIGLPDHIDIAKTDTIGFSITNALCTQLHADIDVNRENGTHITIRFPVNYLKKGSASNL